MSYYGIALERIGQMKAKFDIYLARIITVCKCLGEGVYFDRSSLLLHATLFSIVIDYMFSSH